MENFPQGLQTAQKDKKRRIVMITPEDHEAVKMTISKREGIPYRNVTYEESLKEIIDDLIKPIDALEESGYKGPLFLEKDRFGFRDNGERVRMTLIPTKTINETTSLKCCVTPFKNKISSQRTDLFLSQQISCVMPIRAERPVVMSCLAPEILSLSTAIKKVSGKVMKLLKKFRFQHRTIYIYELDGVVDIHDTERTLTNNGFSSPLRTDFELLEEGVEYNIGSSESDTMYKAYPSQYDPVTRIPSYGRNIVTCVTVDVANANDSVRASESFMRKFAAIRTKEINIKLNKKRILNKMPKIGEIINKPVLLKIVPDTGDIQTMCQDLNIPSGAEDENIYCEPNSYVSKIEVWSNEPLDDPELEELRQGLLDFRHSIAAFLLSIPDEKLSRKAARYKDNYSYSEFRTEDAEITHPLIKLTINSLDIPQEGYKFSNCSGSKTTIQEIYPDGMYVDEYGLPIEVIFPSTSIINRTVPGLLHEAHVGSVALEIKRNIDMGLIDKYRLKEFLDKLFPLMNLENEWEYADMTVDELWDYAQENYIRFILFPYSHDIDVPRSAEILNLLEEYLGYRKHKVYNVRNGVAREMTCDHVVGLLYVFRDMHDTYQGNSCCSIPEISLKGTPIDKDSSRRDGRALYNAQPSKIDILTITFLLNMCTNEDSHLIINGKDERLYSINEQLNAAGVSLEFKKKKMNENILFSDVLDNL